MSIWKILGFGPKEEPAGGDSETVRKIVRELEALPRDEARWIAAFAFVLGRVAYADQEISQDETDVMEILVEDYGGLSETQAVLAVEIAKQQAELFGGTENFVVTREFNKLSTPEQREQMLHSLFAVAAADDSISNIEDRAIRQIASELGFSHREFIDVRTGYSDKREVLKSDR